MKDYSTDIETFGSRPYSVILSIGIVGFDRDTGEIDDGIELNIDAADCVAKGLRMDASTVLWWLKQSDQARAAIAGGSSLEYALKMLTNYLNDTGFDKQSRVWGNGSGFDVNLLEDAYEVQGAKCPWQFWQARDVRTVVDLADLDKKAYRDDNHHTALADAKAQAQMVIDGVHKLRNTL